MGEQQLSWWWEIFVLEDVDFVLSIQVKTQEELTDVLKKSCNDQKKGTTTFIEVILNQELGEPFRRDAMKKPVKVAGINLKDMRPQKT